MVETTSPIPPIVVHDVRITDAEALPYGYSAVLSFRYGLGEDAKLSGWFSWSFPVGLNSLDPVDVRRVVKSSLREWADLERLKNHSWTLVEESYTF